MRENSVDRAFRLIREAPPGFMGIDPGKTGALAYVYESVRPGEPEGFAIPFLELSLQEWFDWLTIASTKVRFAVMEELAAINSGGGESGEGQNGGKKGHAGNAHTQWKLGVNYGSWVYALVAHRFRHRLIRPSVWQAKLEGLKPDKTINKKTALLHEAQRMFPNVSRVTLTTCDALLLGGYAAQLCGFSLAQLTSSDLHPRGGVSGHRGDDETEALRDEGGVQTEGRGVHDGAGGESPPQRKPRRAKAPKAAGSA